MAGPLLEVGHPLLVEGALVGGKNLRLRTALSIALCLVASGMVFVSHASQVCDAGACYPIPDPPPPPDCANVSIPAGHLVATVTGSVKDVRGVPISNASVYWQYGCATSSPTGTFSIAVWSDSSVTMTAAKDHAYRTLTKSNPIAAWNFELQFAVTGTVAPGAFNSSPRTLSFTVYTTAPVAGTKVRVQLPAPFGTFDLSFLTSFSQPDGNWTKWSGSWTSPSGLADGEYIYKVCALDSLANGNCDAPGGLTLALGLDTPTRRLRFVMDSISPTASAFTPTPFTVASNVANVSVSWSDSLAGVDTSSLALKVDGEPVSASVQGTTITSVGLNLATGVHSAAASAADLAGNLRTESIVFTILGLTGSNTTAALNSVTIPVNQGGPPPTTVTFAAPLVSIPSFQHNFSGLTRIGRGTFRRAFSFGNGEVVFTKADGTTASVSVPIQSTNVDYDVAVVAPSAQQLSALLGSRQVQLSDLNVAVPYGFGEVGTTATLVAGSASMSAPISLSSGVLLPFPNGDHSLNVTIVSCLLYSSVCSPMGASHSAWITVGSDQLPVALPPVSRNIPAVVGAPFEPDLLAYTDPGCASNPDPCGQRRPVTDRYRCFPNRPPPSQFPPSSDHCGESNLGAALATGQTAFKAGFGVGCTEVILGGQNICNPSSQTSLGNYAEMFQNVFAYSFVGCELTLPSETCSLAVTPLHFAIWQQDHIRPYQLGQCPGPYQGNVSSKINRVVTNFTPDVPGYSAVAVGHVDEFNDQGVPTIGGQWLIAKLGTNTTGEVAPGVTLPFQLENRINQSGSQFDGTPPVGSEYDSKLNVVMNAAGTQSDALGAAASWWPKLPSSAAIKDLNLFAGASFYRSGTSSPVMLASLTAAMTLTFACS